jgi:hypothetical protein
MIQLPDITMRMPRWLATVFVFSVQINLYSNTRVETSRIGKQYGGNKSQTLNEFGIGTCCSLPYSYVTCICGLLNDSVNSSEYTALNDSVLSE